MAKDILGNVLKPGDKVIFNGLIYDIVEINENRVFGGHIQGNKGTSLKIPDNITLSCDLPFDADKPFNGCVLKVPANNEGDGAKPN